MPKGKTKDPDRQAKVNQTYSMALLALRDKHPDEFNELRKAAAVTLGIEWSPKLTKEQQAERQMAELLDEFPGLAEVFAERFALVQEPMDPKDSEV